MSAVLASLEAPLAAVAAVYAAAWGVASVLVRTVLVAASAAATVSGYVLVVVAWPVTTTLGVLFFVFSPVLYTVAYCLAPLVFLLGLVPKLQVSCSPRPPPQLPLARTGCRRRGSDTTADGRSKTLYIFVRKPPRRIKTPPPPAAPHGPN